jgi:hypothetical protein
MYWQLHLASHPIRHVHLILGRIPQIAVSDTRRKVRFYDLGTGAHYSDLSIDPDLLDNDIPEERRQNLEALKAPNGEYLPFVELNASHLYVSHDGKLRLIHDLNAGLTLEIDDQSIPLDTGKKQIVTHVALDRELGSIAAVTTDQILLVFQQQTLVSTIPLPGEPLVQVFVTVGGGQIVTVDAHSIKQMDTSGRILRQQAIHYTLGPTAMSPDGNWFLAGDADHQLIRLYNRDLIPVRQRHAIDLLSQAHQLQLFADRPEGAAPLVSLDITDDGTLAFAMAGVVCTAHIDLMTELPQPRLLL